MGGLGPGIGATELLVIGIIALLVVGPKDLPLLMRRVGEFMGKARRMAADFRASFDEMARQSELDELRKEVEALRTGSMARPLGAETEATFRQISDDLNRPAAPTASPAVQSPQTPPAIPAPVETVAEPATPAPAARPKTASAKPRATPKPKAAVKAKTPAKARASATKASAASTAPRRKAAAKAKPEAES